MRGGYMIVFSLIRSFVRSLFVSIEVVAPIRETGAQTLTIICNYFRDQPQYSALLKCLLRILTHHGTWEVRHAVLLTLKYIFNVVKVNSMSVVKETDRATCVVQ
jgi:hypothetical protein